MNSLASIRVSATAATLLLLSGPTLTSADTPPPGQQAVSRETREKMAALHEQMAACLRSEKSLAECHSMMVTSCHEQLGSEGCPLMMGSGHGTDSRHRMQPMGSAAKPEDK